MLYQRWGRKVSKYDLISILENLHATNCSYILLFLTCQESNPQEAGKDKVRTLIIGFRESCKAKIESKQLGPREFEYSKEYENVPKYLPS